MQYSIPSLFSIFSRMEPNQLTLKTFLVYHFYTVLSEDSGRMWRKIVNCY
jgi:hypothetical protein